MKKAIPFLLGISIAAAGSLFTSAQETSTMPKLLQIQREFIKPGKSGTVHDKSESNFVQAMARSKWPTHYIALNSMSGKNRALYLTGYDSYGAWQKDSDATKKDVALSAAIDRAEVTDGELLNDFDSAVLSYRERLSYNPRPDLAKIRYIEIQSFHIRSGHNGGFNDLMLIYIDGHKKAGTNANWATYEVAYGAGYEYVVFSAYSSMDEIDSGLGESKKFRDVMGKDGLKKLDDQIANTVESADFELFAINPKQSYPPDTWVKANPDFWKPKPMPVSAKPAGDSK